MLRRDCRHRLGSTVGGAFSSERKPYDSRLQTTLPCAEVIRACSSVPRKPRDASSKSRVSENGSAFSVAACCATTDAEACFGASPVSVWVMLLSSLACRNVAEYFPIDLPFPRALPIKTTDEFGAYARRIQLPAGSNLVHAEQFREK